MNVIESIFMNLYKSNGSMPRRVVASERNKRNRLSSESVLLHRNTINGDNIQFLPQEILAQVLKDLTPLGRFNMMIAINNNKIFDTLADYELLVKIPYRDISRVTQILNTYGNYRYRFRHNGKMHYKKILFMVDLGRTDVSDVSALGGVHTLDLNRTNVEDVSMLGKVHTLNLERTNVEDVSMLGSVHTLNLRNTNVEDVSMLGEVHTLDLGETIVEDVSMLGGVHTLDLYDTDVTDVSMLGNVNILNFD
jgi:hypothetical protein